MTTSRASVENKMTHLGMHSGHYLVHVLLSVIVIIPSHRLLV